MARVWPCRVARMHGFRIVGIQVREGVECKVVRVQDS